MKKVLAALGSGLMLMPFLALADFNGGYVTGAINSIGGWITTAIGFIMALAFLVFAWGLIKYLLSAGDVTAQKEAKGFMIWGIIILFVMVSVWGIVSILQNLTGAQSSTVITSPTIPGVTNTGPSGAKDPLKDPLQGV